MEPPGHTATANNWVAIGNLRPCLNLFRQQASDALLELAILSGVDERVDAAADEHQHHSEVVEPAREVDGVRADDLQEEDNLID